MKKIEEREKKIEFKKIEIFIYSFLFIIAGAMLIIKSYDKKKE